MKHEVVVVFVSVVDKREVTLCRAMEDKLGWFRDEGWMVLGGYVVESFVALSVVDSNIGAFNRVGFKSIHEGILYEFAVVADACAMDVQDIIGFDRDNRKFFWVRT